MKVDQSNPTPLDNFLVSGENNFYLRKVVFVNSRGIDVKSHHFGGSYLDARNEHTIQSMCKTMKQETPEKILHCFF